jgi:hypothetical protein
MANYKYRETNYSGSYGWIEKLEHIDPTSSADSNYIDIHFTKPKQASLSTTSHPHVTFQRANGTSDHWYIVNQQGTWVFDTSGKHGTGVEKRKEIAGKILADALALNWIRAATGWTFTDDEGFTKVETKQSRIFRMQTTY